MSKASLKSLLAASAFLASSAAAGVQAQEATVAQVQQYAAEGAAMGQVTSVSQLRDVRPTDWALSGSPVFGRALWLYCWLSRRYFPW